MNSVSSVHRTSGIPIILLMMSAGLTILLILSLSVGALSIPPLEVLKVFGYRLGLVEGIDETMNLVLFDIRLPRLILTVLVGASLGLAGSVLQGLFRNPLVEPGIIGVSNGAALGAIFCIMFVGAVAPGIASLLGNWMMPVAAFIGGLLATMFALRISQFAGKTQITYLILGGVAVTALSGAVIGLAIFYADDQQLRNYTFWTLGDLSIATWDKLAVLFPLILISTIALVQIAPSLNAIALGESEAFHSGVDVERVKFIAILFSALAVGTAVAYTGIIGFVGLVVPHVIRMSMSSDNRLVLPASAIGGAALLILADIFARTIVAPAELPIGVITAVIGTPFFIYLLISSKKKRLI